MSHENAARDHPQFVELADGRRLAYSVYGDRAGRRARVPSACA